MSTNYNNYNKSNNKYNNKYDNKSYYSKRFYEILFYVYVFLTAWMMASFVYELNAHNVFWSIWCLAFTIYDGWFLTTIWRKLQR